jgi:hypothetical protein
METVRDVDMLVPRSRSAVRHRAEKVDTAVEPESAWDLVFDLGTLVRRRESADVLEGHSARNSRAIQKQWPRRHNLEACSSSGRGLPKPVAGFGSRTTRETHSPTGEDVSGCNSGNSPAGMPSGSPAHLTRDASRDDRTAARKPASMAMRLLHAVIRGTDVVSRRPASRLGRRRRPRVIPNVYRPNRPWHGIPDFGRVVGTRIAGCSFVRKANRR